MWMRFGDFGLSNFLTPRSRMFYVLCRSSSVPWAKDQLDIEQEANKKCEYSETPSHQCEEQTNPLGCASDIKETINQTDLRLDSWFNKLKKPTCASEKCSQCSLWDMLETHPACGAVKAHWADLPGATAVSSHGTWTRGWELKMLDPEGQGRSKVAKRYQRWILKQIQFRTSGLSFLVCENVGMRWNLNEHQETLVAIYYWLQCFRPIALFPVSTV